MHDPIPEAVKPEPAPVATGGASMHDILVEWLETKPRPVLLPFGRSTQLLNGVVNLLLLARRRVTGSMEDNLEGLLADLKARGAMGLAKYGTPLQAGNGRRPAVDGYQELLDAAAYYMQDVVEEQAKAQPVVISMPDALEVTTTKP